MSGTRWKTVAFYGILALLTVLSISIIIVANSTSWNTDTFSKIAMPDLILDAGHGGLDGGAVSETGICEAPITLAIAQKAQLLLKFCGIDALMTRSDQNSLDYDPLKSMKSNKSADLRARLKLARAYPKTPFLSIHLNQFPVQKYHGAQVFYGPQGKLLGEALQHQLCILLNPDNHRVSKPSSDRIFLMKNIAAPAVTIECGFLSNPEECEKLQTDQYQLRIALALTCGWMQYNR